MEFDIDVSGEDIFTKGYTVCIANRDGIIKGYKIPSSIVEVINSRFGQGLYKYNKSQKGKSTLKIRIYTIIIYYLLRSISNINSISLNICRDFNGRERDIENNLYFLLEKVLNLKIERVVFVKLDSDSNAHQYAYLMRRDTKNQMKTYVNISLNDIERFLKK
ncbi:MAG: hypothetical protein V2A62_01370 [Candidatus Woesearchaeota archaeon]